MIRLFGYDVINASIDKDNGGETNYIPYTPPELIEDLMEKYIFTCIAFAGSIAEDIFRGFEEPFASLSVGGGGDDFSKYTKLGFPIGSSDRFLDPVRKIVEENWDLISHIADIICEKKCLSSSEVNEIFQDKDLDEKQEFYKLELSKISLP